MGAYWFDRHEPEEQLSQNRTLILTLTHTHACTHTCMYTHTKRTHTQAHTHSHSQAHAHTHAHTHARTHTHTHARTHTHSHARTHTHMLSYTYKENVNNWLTKGLVSPLIDHVSVKRPLELRNLLHPNEVIQGRAATDKERKKEMFHSDWWMSSGWNSEILLSRSLKCVYVLVL